VTRAQLAARPICLPGDRCRPPARWARGAHRRPRPPGLVANPAPVDRPAACGL